MRENPWARAFVWVSITAILVAAGLYVFRSLRDLPGDVVDKGLDVLDRLESVAAAFRQGTVEVRFLSYATRVSGTNFLQFATLEQTEIFQRSDQASVLWGRFELPEVVVEATAPVTYTYYLDLSAPWELRLENHRVLVLAPEIEFNKPAIDASEIRYESRTSSVFRDEEAALENLKEGLTAMSAQRAREHIALVRELGRRQTAEFVEGWLIQAFGDGEDYAVEVVFADERPQVELPERVE